MKYNNQVCDEKATRELYGQSPPDPFIFLNPPKITDVHAVVSFRVLRMMRAVSSHTDDNRMTASAVAACMAPLLLRPLLAGDCGLEDETEVSPDNAAQLLAATAAANNAQSIVTTLLEEYDHIFEVS